MGAAAGFVTTEPDARYGDAIESYAANNAGASKFVAGGSGTIEITKLGFYCAGSGTSIVLGIFEHDAPNNCPGALVLNSTTAALGPMAGTIEQVVHTYGTKPQLTGGSTYWLAAIGNGSFQISLFDDGLGTALYITSGLTYPTFPTETQWETHTDQTKSYSFYAVYQAVAGGTTYPVAIIRRQYAQQIGA